MLITFSFILMLESTTLSRSSFRFINKCVNCRSINRFSTRNFCQHNKENIQIINQEVERRDSLDYYFNTRDWSLVQNFWSSCIASGDLLPSTLIEKDDEYNPVSMNALHAAGYREYCKGINGDRRIAATCNYAVSFAYVGNDYKGYAYQPDQKTVEGDLREALSKILGKKPRLTVAGRTDKGVSALSQIVNFQTIPNLVGTDYLEALQSASNKYIQEGSIAIHDVKRVPKRFNARSLATWRRYIYLFPLKGLKEEEMERTIVNEEEGEEGDEVIESFGSLGEISIDVDRLNAYLSALEGQSLPYNAYTYGDHRDAGEGLQDVCHLYRARASLVFLDTKKSNNNDEGEGLGLGSEVDDIFRTSNAIAIDLVGSRFLRRMVRILAATALREAARPSNAANTTWTPSDILVKIANNGDRDKSAMPLPPDGLALCAVGYDTSEGAEIRKFKSMPSNLLKVQLLDHQTEEMMQQIERGEIKF